jgi:hypothetical protein
MPYTFMLFKLKTSLEYKMEVSSYITAEVARRVRKGFIKVKQSTDSTLLY